MLPVTVPSAHGALITELSSTSTTPFDPYFARPIVDSTAIEPLARLGSARASRQAPDGDDVEARVDQAAPARARDRPVQRAAGRRRDRDAAALPAHPGARLLGAVERLREAHPRPDRRDGRRRERRLLRRDARPRTERRERRRPRARRLPRPAGQRHDAGLEVPRSRQDAGDRPLERRRPARERDRRTSSTSSRRSTAAGNVAVSTNKGVYYEEATTAAALGRRVLDHRPPPPPSGWFGGNVPGDGAARRRAGDAEPTASLVDVDGERLRAVHRSCDGHRRRPAHDHGDGRPTAARSRSPC